MRRGRHVGAANREKPWACDKFGVALTKPSGNLASEISLVH